MNAEKVGALAGHAVDAASSPAVRASTHHLSSELAASRLRPTSPISRKIGRSYNFSSSRHASNVIHDEGPERHHCLHHVSQGDGLILGSLENSDAIRDWRQSMLRRGNPRLITILMAAIMVSPELAQSDIADPSRGRELAESHCSVCHNVGPYPGGGMASGVPSFFSIGNRPDQAPSRLAGAIINSHPEAPKLSFHLGEPRDIIAYIMSLKAKE